MTVFRFLPSLSAIGLIVFIGTIPAAGQAQMHSQRDAQDYVLAACLTAQPSDYLKDQGYGLAAIVIERSNTTPFDWGVLDAAVKKELARRPMVTIHGDGPVGDDKPMPIARCLDVLESPTIKAAIRAHLGSKRRH